MILEKIDQDLLALAKQSDNDLKDIYAQVDEPVSYTHLSNKFNFSS